MRATEGGGVAGGEEFGCFLGHWVWVGDEMKDEVEVERRREEDG